MARNGSGDYSLPAGNPVSTGTTISSTWANNTLSDIASALTQSISKDGQTTYTGNQPMGGNRHTNVGNATARNEYATLGQVQDSAAQYLTSVSGTDTITASLTGLAAYVTGLTFRFVPANTNTGAVTLNVNGLGAIAVTKQGALALSAGDIVSGAAAELLYDGTQFQLLNPAVQTDSLFAIADQADNTKKLAFQASTISTGQTRTRTVYDKSGYETVANDIWGLHNVSLGASVAGNNLTLSLLTNAGATPSASDPAIVGFRNSTATNGTPAIIAVTAATTLTITAGSTLGCANGEIARIWVCAINNGGTVELACYRAWNGTGWRAFNEQILSTTAEGTGTADSAQVLYSANARVGVAMRYLGYVEIQYGTAAWSNAPTFVQTNHSRMPLPGTVVQRQYLSDGAYATGVSSIPNDDSIPQIGEGTQFLSLAITPSSSFNVIAAETRGLFTTNAAGEYVTAALFNGATDALAASVSSQNGADPQMQTLYNQRIGGTTSPVTYTVRAGTASGGNATYFNGWSAGRQRGGVMNSYLRLDEIFV